MPRRPAPHPWPTRAATAAFGAAVAFGVPASARADITYVVQPGHTLETIAHRYHVSVQALRDANHLGDGHLSPGQRLVIPGVDAHASSDHPAHGATATSPHDASSHDAHGHGDPNLVHAVRGNEDFRIRLRDRKDPHGKITPAAIRSFTRLMRQGEGTHEPDPRLVALIGVVAAHFDGKTIEVVSGYRAYTPTQYTAHSNHNLGKALDFHIQGVSNEALRDFCRTLRNTGCGYYPNSTFVHLDVRDASYYWVDVSRPGEHPQYERPGVTADEGIGDVPVVDPP